MHTIKLAGITNVAIDTRSCPRCALVRRIRICHTTLAVLLANRCICVGLMGTGIKNWVSLQYNKMKILDPFLTNNVLLDAKRYHTGGI